MSNTATGSTSVLNQATEAVAGLINGLSLFATMTRGALGTGNYIAFEIGPTAPDTVFLNKGQYIPIDFTINVKHINLLTLSDAMNRIHEYLTMLREYPAGNGWEIVDITTTTEPQIIAREDNNAWVMASALAVKVYMHAPEPATPTAPADPGSEPDADQE